jgi:hypothetical protein
VKHLSRISFEQGLSLSKMALLESDVAKQKNLLMSAANLFRRLKVRKKNCLKKFSMINTKKQRETTEQCSITRWFWPSWEKIRTILRTSKHVSMQPNLSFNTRNPIIESFFCWEQQVYEFFCFVLFKSFSKTENRLMHQSCHQFRARIVARSSFRRKRVWRRQCGCRGARCLAVCTHSDTSTCSWSDCWEARRLTSPICQKLPRFNH